METVITEFFSCADSEGFLQDNLRVDNQRFCLNETRFASVLPRVSSRLKSFLWNESITGVRVLSVLSTVAEAVVTREDFAAADQTTEALLICNFRL